MAFITSWVLLIWFCLVGKLEKFNVGFPDATVNMELSYSDFGLDFNQFQTKRWYIYIYIVRPAFTINTFSNKTYGNVNNDIRIISFLIHILPQQSWLAEHTTNIELKIKVHQFFGSFTIKMFSLSTKYSFGYSSHLFRCRCCLFTHCSFSSLLLYIKVWNSYFPF